jgi:GT2 family glycosyltransferase
MDPVLSIIIVNWNTRSDLASCLSSIKEVPPSGFAESIVVDNASQDDSVAFVRREFPDAILIANSTNKGFSGGVNAGLNIARGEFILILNPDIIVRPGVIEPLISYLRDHPDVGAVMPLLRNFDGSVQQGYIRRLPTLRQVFWFHTGLDQFGRRSKERVEEVFMITPRHGTSPVEVPQIPGAFILTRKRTVSEIGLWDEAYKLFYEDVDWCDRVRANGMRLVMLPWIETIHAGGKSFETASSKWLLARFSVSLVTFFRRRRTVLHALTAAAILGVNACMAIIKNGVQFLFGGNQRRQESAKKITKYSNILRLFARAFILRNDRQVLPVE